MDGEIFTILGDVVCQNYGMTLKAHQDADLEIFYEAGGCTPAQSDRRAYTVYNYSTLGKICCRYMPASFGIRVSDPAYEQTTC